MSLGNVSVLRTDRGLTGDDELARLDFVAGLHGRNWGWTACPGHASLVELGRGFAQVCDSVHRNGEPDLWSFLIVRDHSEASSCAIGGRSGTGKRGLAVCVSGNLSLLDRMHHGSGSGSRPGRGPVRRSAGSHGVEVACPVVDVA